MIIRYTHEFLRLLKKKNVRIRKSVKNSINEFAKNPDSPILKNHSLKREWAGYSSINVTSDYRAIYKEIRHADEMIIYFTTIGTHKELYK